MISTSLDDAKYNLHEDTDFDETCEKCKNIKDLVLKFQSDTCTNSCFKKTNYENTRKKRFRVK